MTSASVASDLEIARSVKPRPILDVAHDLGLRDDEIEPYGSNKAKIRLEAITRLEAERPRGKQDNAGNREEKTGCDHRVESVTGAYDTGSGACRGVLITQSRRRRGR